MKDRVLYGVIIVLIIWLIVSDWLNKREQSKMYNQLQEQNKMIVEMDKTTKEKDGQYAKLVNYFATQKELNEDLSRTNKDLSNTIKKQGEKLLMLTNTVISFRNEFSEGFISVNPEDSSIFDMSLKYPNSEESFVHWDGSVFTNTRTYKGEWSFKKLPLQIVLTETDRGLWKTRLVGPEWLVVDSIEVKSLPPSEFDNSPKTTKFGIMLGGGYIKSFDPLVSNAISVGAGFNYRNNSIIFNATTNKTVGASYYYTFNRVKRKK